MLVMDMSKGRPRRDSDLASIYRQRHQRLCMESGMPKGAVEPLEGARRTSATGSVG